MSTDTPFSLEFLSDRILENLTEMIFVKDVHGRFLYMSPACRAFLGLALDADCTNTSDSDFFKKRSYLVDNFRRDDMKVMKTGEPISWFKELCHPDCQKYQFIVRVSKQPVFLPLPGDPFHDHPHFDDKDIITTPKGRKVIGVLGIMHDVTQEVQIEKALMLGKVGTILWRRKTDRVIIEGSVHSLFGLKPPENGVQNIGELRDELAAQLDDASRTELYYFYVAIVRDKIDARRHADRPQDIEIFVERRVKLKNVERWLNITYENCFEDERDPESVYVLIMIQDVTALHENVIELEATKQKLQLQNKKLSEIKERLERANRGLVIGTLSAATLHDAAKPIQRSPAFIDRTEKILSEMRSAMTPAQASISDELLLDLQDQSESCNTASAIISHIQDILHDISLIERRPLDAATIVEKSLGSVAYECRSKKIMIRRDIPDYKLWYVTGDRLALRVVVNILVDNAIKYGCNHDGERSITVKISDGPKEDFTVIEFSDSGEGIPEAILQNIQEPYSVPIENRHGMGFGLLIAQTLLFHMGGYLHAKSGPGARISIELPSAKSMT